MIEAHEATSLLMQFSEWMDPEPPVDDPAMTHEDLVGLFLAGRSDAARPEVVES